VLINLDYDDRLNLLEADFWCPNTCWSGEDCACDYTHPDKGDCDKHNKGSCASKCAPQEEDRDLYCTTKPRILSGTVVPSRPVSGWTVLKDGVLSRNNVLYKLNEEHYFRFYTSSSCKYIRVAAIPLKGTLKIEVATPKTWVDEFPFVYSSQRMGYSEISICPSDENFAPGTFFIRVSATAVYTEYSILVETVGQYKLFLFWSIPREILFSYHPIEPSHLLFIVFLVLLFCSFSCYSSSRPARRCQG